MPLSHRSLRSLLITLAATGAAGLPGLASAQYEATAYAGSSNPIGHTTTPGDVTYSQSTAGAPGTSNHATISFTASPVASITLSADANNPYGQISAGAAGILTYGFEVTAAPFSVVPIDYAGLYTGFVFSSSGASQTFSASVVVQSVGSGPYVYSAYYTNFYGNCSQVTCLTHTGSTADVGYGDTSSDPYHAAGSFDGTLALTTGADGTVRGSVQLFASAGATSFFGYGLANGYLDPHLDIDAAYLAAHPGATLTITPGVGNAIAGAVTPVPEPGTWALVLVGIGALGLRRRR